MWRLEGEDGQGKGGKKNKRLLMFPVWVPLADMKEVKRGSCIWREDHKFHLDVLSLGWLPGFHMISGGQLGSTGPKSERMSQQGFTGW